ncbi:integral membrane sensor signal transduction histidine kinase ['Nostoc azollae' 0708]|jgi:heavy metal sensor kinase|uniref:histidine kinase n=2 Tax=Trichormus azollae TaxID=1164 RepID=D7DXE2_NOSA0|nr:integral membrane sensor signal transduction histidine kinase ['Nostoc azollae' 0708]
MEFNLKIRSFRLRIALLSASLAGSALIGFGFASCLLIYKTKVDALDAEIKSQLLANNTRPPRFDNTLQKSTALLVVDRDGETLYQSNNWPSDLNSTILCSPQSELNCQPFPPPLPPRQQRQFLIPNQLPPLPPPMKLSQVSTKQTYQEVWRIGVITSPHHRLIIAISLSEIDREMSVIRNVFSIAVPIVLILVAIAAWWLSGTALQPIRKVTTTIRGVTVKGLSQRIPMGTTDVEFIELIGVFNQMMERLERSFQQASRFSGDAAHELKTPLAILQGELELALQKAEPASQLQQSLSNLINEVRRLSSIVRKLLLLSLADAGQMQLYQIDVDVSKILADLIEDIEILAPDLQVETNIAADLWVKADKDLLTQIIQNLISNAIKYNVPSGWLRIDCQHKNNLVYLTVTNSSQDISPQDKERLFERFYRGDLSHNRQIEGIGLGLSLSREIARAHNGDLQLDDTFIGETAFTLKLGFSTPSTLTPTPLS